MNKLNPETSNKMTASWYPHEKSLTGIGGYMINEMSLSTQEHGIISCAPVLSTYHLPALFAGNQDALSLQAQGDFGSLTFHELKTGNYCIRQNEFNAKKDITLSTQIDSHSLAFHYTLKNNIRFIIKGHPENVIHKHQYNMVYMPKVEWDYIFSKDEEYTCFEIHFSLDYLIKCREAFPLLTNFLRNVEKRTISMISHGHLYASTEMMDIIQSILQCRFTGTLKSMYLDSKIPGLLFLSLQGIPATEQLAASQNLGKYDRQKVMDAREHILQNLDNPGTLQEIAQEIGINVFKLKNGFKKMFGTTVFNFLLDERMKRAKILLYEEEKSIHEISILTGYRNFSNFSVAFKRKFGYPPSKIKRKNSGTC